MNWINVIILVIGSVGTISLEIICSPLLVKWAIEQGGTALVGAKVDVGSADVRIHDFSFSLNRLEVTDVNDTMKNVVDIGRIRFALNLNALLESKTVIEVAAVENIQLGTKRRYDGKVRRAPAPAKNAETSSRPAMGGAIDEVKKKLEIDALLKGDMASLKALRALETSGSVVTEKWKSGGSMDYGKRAAAAADKVKNLDTKIDTSNLVKAQEDARAKIAVITEAKKAIDAVTTELAAKKKELDTDMGTLTSLTAQAEKASRDEYNALLKKLNIEGVSVQNVAGMVFGPQATGPLFAGMYWLDKINKTIPPNVRKNITLQKKQFGSRGYDIELPLKEMAYPSFHIGLLRISANEAAQGNETLTSPFIAGEIRDIVSDQDHIGRPMTAELSVMVPAYGKAKGSVSALFDRRNGAALDSYNITVKDMPISGMVFGDGANGMPMRLASAVAAADAVVTFSSARSEASVRVVLSRMDMEFKKDGLDEFSSIVRDTLSSVKDMTITVGLRSENGRVDTTVSSDLDRKLADGLKKLFGAKTEALRKYLDEGFARAVGAEEKRVLSRFGKDQSDIAKTFGAEEKAVNTEREKLEQKKKEIENNLNAYQNELNRKADEGKKKAESEVKNKAGDLLKQNRIPGF